MLRNYSHINGIITRKLLKRVIQCNDGSYSTARKAPCRTRGGIKPDSSYGPMPNDGSCTHSKGYASHNVYVVPLSDISVNHHLFQNREEEYSQESVDRIKKAVYTDSFIWENFDPILLWASPSGELYVLSGHSRTQAFRELDQENQKAKGKHFNKIPAKILEGISEKQAQRIAYESNTLGTKESIIERANFYRNLRTEGTNEKGIIEQAKTNEGANWRKIHDYSFLNVNGKTWNALKLLEGKDMTSNENMRVIAFWIGRTRGKYPMLSNMHENELYDYLSKQYGKRYTRANDFLKDVYTVIQRRSFMGELSPNTSLNLENTTIKSDIQKEFDRQTYELQKTVNDLEKQVQQKITLFERNKASKADIDRVITPLEMQLRTARQKLSKHLNTRSNVQKMSNQQNNLFASVSGVSTHQKLQNGDILKVSASKMPFAYHYGIVCIIDGDIHVMHNTPSKNTTISHIDDFFKNRQLKAVLHSKITGKNTADIMRRFSQCKGTYNALSYNCEHFICCMLGQEQRSPQLRNALLFGAITTFLILR